MVISWGAEPRDLSCTAGHNGHLDRCCLCLHTAAHRQENKTSPMKVQAPKNIKREFVWKIKMTSYACIVCFEVLPESKCFGFSCRHACCSLSLGELKYSACCMHFMPTFLSFVVLIRVSLSDGIFIVFGYMKLWNIVCEQ